jgi:transposase
LKRRLRRGEFLAFMAKQEVTTIGIEACGASHHWARELRKLGHTMMLIPAQYVKAYVVRGKNDAADAEAICEAMSRPHLKRRLVPVKSADQSAAQMLMGTREHLIRRRTQLSNMIRGHASEFGVVSAKGLDKLEALLERIAEDDSLPALGKEMFATLGEELAELAVRLATIDARLKAWHRANELSQRLVKIPTIGPIGACLLAIKVADPKAFRSGRMCAAWLGLTPKDHSTGGKQKLGGITRAGDEILRATLVAGATAYLQQVRRGRTEPSPWLAELLKRKPPKLVAVALANKSARIAWKLMVSGQSYDHDRAVARKGLAASQCGGSASSPLLHRTTASKAKRALIAA